VLCIVGAAGRPCSLVRSVALTSGSKGVVVGSEEELKDNCPLFGKIINKRIHLSPSVGFACYLFHSFPTTYKAEHRRGPSIELREYSSSNSPVAMPVSF
jgi:hypothetical protein